MKCINRFGVAAGVLLAMTLSGRATTTTLVQDTWIDGTRTDPTPANGYSENGTDTDGDGNLESAWFGSSASLSVNNANPGVTPGTLVGTVGATTSAFWTSYFTPAASPVTLANVGDSIHVTWVFTPTGVNAANTSQGFNLAIASSQSAVSRVSSDTSPVSSVYSSYAMFMNMGQTLGNANPFQLREWNLGAANGSLLGASGNYTSLANGATSGNTGYASGTQYTFQFTLTHNAANGLDINATMTGGSLNNTGTESVNFTDTTPNGFVYDTFAIRPSSASTSASEFDTSLFQVDFTTGAVPEPSTLAIMGVAACGLMGWYRRSRA